MAFRCNECLYDVNTWCEKYESDIGCGTCERLDTGGRCKCLLRDITNCPDFIPKEEKANDTV